VRLVAIEAEIRLKGRRMNENRRGAARKAIGCRTDNIRTDGKPEFDHYLKLPAV